METTEKICAHGLCNCLATQGSDYCSPYCGQVGKTTNNTLDENQKMICDCGHPTCVG
ncbi:MAG TPA: hypothetical protein VGO91_14145 [Pyrinomonadaceae bacterium]|jgi:hypothetical protein|nr:hypothetical protein [Pyrinomonadaceae bacterium]